MIIDGWASKCVCLIKKAAFNVLLDLGPELLNKAQEGVNKML